MNDLPLSTILGAGAVPRGAPVIRSDGPRRIVWDLGVRVFHWLLVASVAAALLTGWLAPKSWLDLHVWLGAPR